MTQTPLRILIVCRALPCHVRGGLEFHAVDLAAGLAERGHGVHLLSAEASDKYIEELCKLGIEHHAIAGAAAERYTFDYLRRIGGRIEALHAEHGFDIIHGQEFALGFWKPGGAFAQRVALTVHGTMTSETPLHRDVFSHLSAGRKIAAIGRFGRRMLFGPAWRAMLRRSGRVLVDSVFTETELKRLAPEIADHVRRVSLGVDLERYPEILRDDARRTLGWNGEKNEGETGGPTFLTLGRLEWQKGHDLALEALARLGDRPWRYVIAGEGKARAELETLAGELGVSGKVEFAGRVDEETKARMLAAADVFLWPERTHPAFGLVGLEAMLMGTPVAGARRGAIGELIDSQSGWGFDPESVESLCDLLEEILDHPERIEAMGRDLRGRAIERFDPGAMAERTEEVYREMMDEP